jgi:cyclic dehypoxanthinyl futalosine synthase
VDRVRQRISPLKAMSDDWLEVMDVAHRLGLNSSATMMFGHVETVEDRIEHLERLRAQQDKSKGGRRRAERGRSPRSSLDLPGRAHEAAGADRRGARVSAHAGAGAHLPRQLPSVQSSWVTQGQEIGQVALKFGANDPGQHHDRGERGLPGGHDLPHDVADMQRLIRNSATSRTSGIIGIGC